MTSIYQDGVNGFTEGLERTAEFYNLGSPELLDASREVVYPFAQDRGPVDTLKSSGTQYPLYVASHARISSATGLQKPENLEIAKALMPDLKEEDLNEPHIVKTLAETMAGYILLKEATEHPELAFYELWKPAPRLRKVSGILEISSSPEGGISINKTKPTLRQRVQGSISVI